MSRSLDPNEPASQHYSVDPLGKSAAQLSPEEQSRILGGEAAEWTEYLSPEILTGRAWPRAAAIAEWLWSPQGTTDVDSIYRRLAVFQRNLAWYNLNPDFNCRPTFERLTEHADRAPLTVLARVVEPPKEYTREEARSYSAYTPLNRMVDAVPAESDEAREFTALAKRISAGTAAPGELAQARERLMRWEANDKVLRPQLGASALTRELVPVSADLSRAAAMGLAVLDVLESAAIRMPPSSRPTLPH